MNLMTVIGNAVADRTFLEALFADPTRTVELYGFQLTNCERQTLLDYTTGPKSKELKEALHLAAFVICPEQPCASPHAVVPPDKKAAKTELPKVA